MTQKIKFQISGMHCDSCAALIEERLKKHPGVVKTKVSFDSGKGIVIYDGEKIKKEEIAQIIKKTGDFKIEEIRQEEKKKSDSANRVENAVAAAEEKAPTETQKENEPEVSKILSSIKVLTGISIASLAIGAISLIVLFGQSGAKKGNQNPSPTVQQPSAIASNSDGAAQPASFKIVKEDHIRGEIGAPVTLVEFSDFECPFSARHFPTMSKLSKEYGGKVAWVFKHFPLPFHKNAQKAAEASECAGEQGKFWEYHDKLFENVEKGYSLENFKSWAADLNLDAGKFNACLDSGKYAQKVSDDSQEGQAKGVSGTPSTFINGQLVSGALSYETLKQKIDGLLK